MNRFVVLEHHWNGTHWDVMLESGDALCTWAIDAPIVAGVVLPARRLADHRLAYLEYEGPVSGGRGTVRRWDSGTYEALDWTADRVLVRLAGRQLVGELELRMGPGAGVGAGETWRWTFLLGKAD